MLHASAQPAHARASAATCRTSGRSPTPCSTTCSGAGMRLKANNAARPGGDGPAASGPAVRAPPPVRRAVRHRSHGGPRHGADRPWAVPSPERGDHRRAEDRRAAHDARHDDPDEPAHRSLLFDALDEFKRWLWHYVVEPNLDDDDLRLFFTMFDTGTTILAGHHRGRADRVRLRQRQRRGPAASGSTARRLEITVEQRPLRARALRHGVRVQGRRRRTSPTWPPAPPCTTCCGSSSPTASAFAWKMQAGMGDTVFTPFYEVLKRRGVHFEFFHWVSKLGLSPDKRLVDSIEVIPQVALKTGDYEPLVEVHGLLCWPSEPDWDQIVEGEELRRARREPRVGARSARPRARRRLVRGERLRHGRARHLRRGAAGHLPGADRGRGQPGVPRDDRQLAHGDDPGLPALAQPDGARARLAVRRRTRS